MMLFQLSVLSVRHLADIKYCAYRLESVMHQKFSMETLDNFAEDLEGDESFSVEVIVWGTYVGIIR